MHLFSNMLIFISLHSELIPDNWRGISEKRTVFEDIVFLSCEETIGIEVSGISI